MTTLSTTTTALLTAAIAALAALAKKFLPRKKPALDHITRTEFHDAMDRTRDRIGASYLALADKIEQQHNQVLTTLAHQGDTFERRLDKVEATLARLDERTTTRQPRQTTWKLPT